MKTNMCTMVENEDGAPRFVCCENSEYSEQKNCSYYRHVPEKMINEYAVTCEYCYKGNCNYVSAKKEAVLIKRLELV